MRAGEAVPPGRESAAREAAEGKEAVEEAAAGVVVLVVVVLGVGVVVERVRVVERMRRVVRGCIFDRWGFGWDGGCVDFCGRG